MERFQGARSSPGTSINSPVGINTGANTDRSTGRDVPTYRRTHPTRVERDTHDHRTKASSTEKERRLFKPACCVQVALRLPSLSEFWWTGLSYPLYLPRRRPLDGPEQSSGQRRTRFTLHRHPKNPALNKGGIQDSISVSYTHLTLPTIYSV